MDKPITKFFEKFNFSYRVKAQKLRVLMGSKKYKDAYFSDIQENIEILGEYAVAINMVTKISSKSRKHSLSFIIGNLNEMDGRIQRFLVFIQVQKHDSNNIPRRDDTVKEHLVSHHLSLGGLCVNSGLISPKRRTKAPKEIFRGSLKEFRGLDIVELVTKNLEDYIPID